MRAPAYLLRLGDSLGLQPNVTSYLVQEMTSPHRHYHTVHHLALMERHLHDQCETTYSNREFGRKHWRDWLLATLFHDIVYDPTASDNEEVSAMEMKLRIGNMERVNIELIERMILATKTHAFVTGWPQTDEDRAVNWFLRADLSILWSPLRTYQWYAHGVRKEYGHVPNELYRKGRAAVLEKLKDEIDKAPIEDDEYRQMLDNMLWESDALLGGLLDV